VARLRFEEVPSVGRYLVVATARRGGLPASLAFVRFGNGTVASLLPDVLGLEPGLDLGNGRGPVVPANPPNDGVVPGFDADTDPTLVWVDEATSVPGSGRARPDARPRMRHPNPFTPPGEIRFSVRAAGVLRVEIADAAGRRVRRLFEGFQDARECAVTWDGRGDTGEIVPAGIYFLQVQGAGGIEVSKLLLLP
jgi:hypothetical protein